MSYACGLASHFLSTFRACDVHLLFRSGITRHNSPTEDAPFTSPSPSLTCFENCQRQPDPKRIVVLKRFPVGGDLFRHRGERFCEGEWHVDEVTSQSVVKEPGPVWDIWQCVKKWGFKRRFCHCCQYQLRHSLSSAVPQKMLNLKVVRAVDDCICNVSYRWLMSFLDAFSTMLGTFGSNTSTARNKSQPMILGM